MRDVLTALLSAWRAGEPAGLATVVGAWSSAPQPVGAAMLVRADGSVTGGVSGGCVEGAVYELCREAARSGQPRAERYGVSDDDALAAGLPCGGTIEVFVQRAGFPELEELATLVAEETPVALLTVVAGDAGRLGRTMVVTGDARFGSLGPALDPARGTAGEVAGGRPWTAGDEVAGGRPEGEGAGAAAAGDEADVSDEAVAADARGLLAAGRTAVLRFAGGISVLVNSFPARPRLLIFGATPHAAALSRIGRFLGYRVTVCDARPVFATTERLPDADEVVTEWPHRYLEAQARAGRVDGRTAVCVLTHDPKFDVPVLAAALRLPVAYVGAMGSRRTHEDRLRRLRDAGLTEERIGRLASPIGLDLGARTPEETAVSIAAEIVALRERGSGRRLTGTDGPIHREVGFSPP